jgi:hypothetical protein
MKFDFKIILTYLVLASCGPGDSDKKDVPVAVKDSTPSSTVKTADNIQENEKEEPFYLRELNRDSIFSSHLKELKSYLFKNKIAPFLKDECLDVNNMFYATVNLHKYVSLRKDLIDQLSPAEAKKLLAVGKDPLLDQICSDSTLIQTVPYFKKTTRMLLQARANN